MMNRDELCSIGTIFVEDENYVLSRYNEKDQDLYFKAWNETFENSPVQNDENFKRKSWEDVLSDKNKLQLKITTKNTQEYIGEVMLMNLDMVMPELGIQLLQKFQNKGIGTRVMKLFVNQLKSIMKIDSFSVRIRSDNYASQRMFEKIGVVKIGEEKEHAKMMYELMMVMGKEK